MPLAFESPALQPGYTGPAVPTPASAPSTSYAGSAGGSAVPPQTTTSGGSAGSAAATAGPIDWQSYLGMFGLPPDVVAKVSQIFQNDSDVSRASQAALAYIRGTQWYRDTYPGIQDAIQKGLVADERGYRANMTAFNQIYRQYIGRDITPSEYSAALREGIDPQIAAYRFAGAANARAYGREYNYALGAFGEQGRVGEQDLQTLGEQKVGFGSTRGALLDKMLRDAQTRMERVFQGVLAGPSLSAAGGRIAQSITGQLPSDVGR